MPTFRGFDNANRNRLAFAQKIINPHTTEDELVELPFNFLYRGYTCARCHGAVMTMELIEDLIAQGDKAVFDAFTKGIFCAHCDTIVHAVVIRNGIVQVAIPGDLPLAEQPKLEKWFELDDIYYQQWADNICPCCAREFILSGSNLCTNCGAKLLPAQKVLKLREDEMAWQKRNRDRAKDSRGRWYAEASIMWDGLSKTYKVRFDWVGQEFVDLFKMLFPASDRAWDAKDKVWIIANGHFDDLKVLFEAKFTKVTLLSKEEVEKEWESYQNVNVRAVNVEARLQEFCQLLEKAGVAFDKECKDGSEAKRAHRRAALYFHPDRHPDRADDMIKLNAAFQDLQEYFGLAVKYEQQT